MQRISVNHRSETATPKKFGGHGTRRFPTAAACLFAFMAVVQTGCEGTSPQNYEARLSDVLSSSAMEAEKAKDYQRAVRHFETLYERDKSNAAVVRDLARNLRYAGAPLKAVTFLKENMKSLGRRPELVLELAKAQLAASLLQDAEETLTEARRLLPGNWQVHSAWGVYYDRRGKFDDARKAYQRALELSPNNFAVLNNLALSYALAGKIDLGIETLRKVTTSEKSNSLARQNLALLYGIKGDMQAARRLSTEDLPKNLVDQNLSAYRSFHE